MRLAFVVLLGCLTVGSIHSLITGPGHGKVVVCYIGTWAVYRPGRGSFTLEHIDPNMCTHLVYSFAGLNTTHDSIRSLDPWQDLTEDYGKGGYERIVRLKDRYPHLKVTIAIGGWNEGSENYSKLAADPMRRSRFVQSAVQFLKKYNFDGLDLDWEFPGKRGGTPADKQNFLLLVKELRSAFNPFNFLLTAAFGAGKDTIDVAYDVAGLSVYLDYIHMMCYDYHGTWDQKTGANAPLFSTDVYSVEYSIEYMLQMGAPATKLVMGIPLYGRTFILPESVESEAPAFKKPQRLGEIAKSVGFQGPLTRENGFMGYNEICVEMRNKTARWSQHWDEKTRTPFLALENKVIAYDDPRSIREKIKFAISKRLAGAMVWSIDTDDFQGDCVEQGLDFKNFPLMRSINKAIIAELEEDRRNKENEILHGDGNSKISSANVIQKNIWVLLVFVVHLFVVRY